MTMGEAVLDEDTVLRAGSEVFYVATEQGVWIRGPLGTVSISGGEGAYRLIDWLVHQCDGAKPWSAVLQAVPERQRPVVTQVVDRLLDGGFIRAVIREQARVDDRERDLYADVLAFLESQIPDPVARFRRWRETGVAVVGPEHLLNGVVGSLVELGCGRVAVHPVRTSVATDIAPRVRLGDLARGAARRDLRQSVTVADPSDSYASALTATAEHARCVVVGPAGREDWERITETLWDGCRVVAVVGVVDDADISCVLAPPGPCPTCAAAALGASERRVDEVPPSPAGASIVALDTARRILADTIEVADETQLTSVRRDTLTVTSHEILPRRECGAACSVSTRDVPDDGLIRPDTPDPRADDLLVAEQDAIVARVARLTDPLVGPLLEVGERAYAQLPLAVSSATRRQPDGRSATVVMAGPNPREARYQAVLRTAQQVLIESTGSAAVGTGWSAAEARWRALAAWTLEWASLQGPEVWKPMAEPPAGGLAGHLAELLAVADMPAGPASVAEAPSGLVVVRLAGTGPQQDAVLGVGDRVESALAHAREALLVRHADYEARAEAAHPAPAGPRWSDVLSGLPQDGPVVSDVAPLWGVIACAQVVVDG